MKKKRKRKKSSARRASDSSEEESDAESKVFLFFLNTTVRLIYLSVYNQVMVLRRCSQLSHKLLKLTEFDLNTFFFLPRRKRKESRRKGTKKR